MKFNQHTAVSTSKVLLVPYEPRHVPRYHEFMTDPAILEATASEPLTLPEEYENQKGWRAAHDKLTFILCLPAAKPSSGDLKAVVAGQDDKPDRMIGDINLILHPWDEEDEAAPGAHAGPGGAGEETRCVGEIDIMIASLENRRRGLGKAALLTFLRFVLTHERDVLREYAASSSSSTTASKGSTGQKEEEEPKPKPKLRLGVFVAKIKASNANSIALFRGLGFEQVGDVNYFGEVKLVLRDFGSIPAPPDEYVVVEYSEPRN